MDKATIEITCDDDTIEVGLIEDKGDTINTNHQIKTNKASLIGAVMMYHSKDLLEMTQEELITEYMNTLFKINQE